jgi:U3 small nucleolar RNA-associated protein 14
MEIKEDTKEDKLKGWGSWAGFGIEQKKTSPEEKLKRKKLEIVK